MPIPIRPCYPSKAAVITIKRAVEKRVDIVQ